VAGVLAAGTLAAASAPAAAAAPGTAAAGPAAEKVRRLARSHRSAHEVAILREFVELLSLPNLASNGPGIRRNADHIVGLLRRRGLETRLLEAEGAPPAVYGELRVPGARRTLLVYAHYDGQPVDRSQWATEPWTPVLREGTLESGRVVPFEGLTAPLNAEWRLYARSAGDDKAPVVGLLAALDALRAASVPLSVNLKVFFEGEEEAGSPHLPAVLARHAKLLAADAWLLCDGPVHQTRKMQVFFGARGVTDVEVTVYGPIKALHSGHYGNWAPNPAVVLAQLLTELRDADGRVLVDGYGDDVRPLTAREKEALAASPAVDDALRREFALAATEANNARLVERLMLPALNVRGVEAGRVGARAANAIPTEATASIDFRLVPDQTPQKVRERVEAHLAKRGYSIVHETPDAEKRRTQARLVKLEWGAGYPPSRTSMDLPASRAVVRVIEEATGGPVVVLPTLGGSVPMHLFAEATGSPIIGVPIANHDNNQHAANENLRLQNLWDGIEVYAGLLARLGGVLEEEAGRSR
jgi:acetylornithine deacetylase/succinyl-diaminopimelate desuccinylase-like protein